MFELFFYVCTAASCDVVPASYVYDPAISFVEKQQVGMAERLYDKVHAETSELYADAEQVTCETKGNLAMTISQFAELFEDIDYVCIKQNHLDGLTRAKLHFAEEK